MARAQDLPKLGEALGRGYKEAKTEATKAQAEIQARASGESTDAPPAGATPTPAAPDAAPPAGAGRPDPTA